MGKSQLVVYKPKPPVKSNSLVVYRPKRKSMSKALAARKGFTLNRGMTTLFPQRKNVKMVFEYFTGLTASTTQNNFGTSQAFSLNSIYSPQVTSPFSRPQGYDQIVNIYKRYKVYGCKMELTFSNPTADGLWVCCRATTSDTSDDPIGETVSSAGMKKWTTVKPINDTGSQVVHINRYWNIAAIEGLTKSQFKNDIDKYAASIAASPSYVPVIYIAVNNTASTTQYAVGVNVKLTYYVQLYDRNTFGTSTV